MAGLTSVSAYHSNGVLIAARFLQWTSGKPTHTQSTVSKIEATVYDRGSSTPTTPTTATHELTKASVIFNTLQTGDTRWTGAGGDATGYNFLYICPASWFPTRGREYVVRIDITPTDGTPVHSHEWWIETKDLVN